MRRWVLILMVSAGALLGCKRGGEAHARGPAAQPIKVAPSNACGSYAKKYTFTEDWFSQRIPVWCTVMESWRGKPNLHYLEVGVFEGRSALWMLENVLTDSSSRLTGVDVFMGRTKETYLANLEVSGRAGQATTIQGYSGVELRKLPLDSYDIIYIDGSHTADDVLADAVLSWGLLKDGGMLIFDDYAWSGYPTARQPPTPDELRPRGAVDGFITAYRNTLEVIHHDYQVIVKKRPNPCEYKEGCSPVGGYTYRWWQRKLYRHGSTEAEPLSEHEADLVERLLQSRPYGRVGFAPDGELRREKGFVSLTTKLGLKL